MVSIYSLIKKYKISPKKRLGQHFLAAAPTAEKIVNSMNIEKGETVIEIGSGPGVMTGFIAERARRVYAVEKDSNLLKIAGRELARYRNIVLINEDILNLDIGKTIDRGEGVKIIGNLPYNISSQIIFWMIDNRVWISKAAIMLQKEVALRVCARPGGKDYGILSVLSQSFANCKRLFDVSAKSFVPPPEVVSSVIMMDFEDGNPKIDDELNLKRIVRAAFGKRRKTLRNSLLGARNLQIRADDLDRALAACDIEPRRRPETLSVDEYIRLAVVLRDKR